MKVLHRLLIKSYLGPLLLTFLVVQFVLIMQFLWKYIDDMVGKGLEATIILELIFYASATLVPMALPLAVLLSSIMTMGNLAESYELTALKAAGTSFFKIIRPLVVLNLLIAFGAFAFSNIVLPKSYLKFGQLLYDVRKKKPALDIKAGVFYDQIDNYIIRVEEKEADNSMIRGVKIWDHSDEQGRLRFISASNGKMEVSPNEHFLVLKLNEGKSFEEMEPRNKRSTMGPLFRSSFAYQELHFDLSAFQFDETDESLFKDHYKMLNVKQLDSVISKEEKSMYDRKKRLISYIDNFYIFGNDSTYGSLETAQLEESQHLKGQSFIDTFSKTEQNQILRESISNIQSIKGYLNMLKRETEFTESSLAKLNIEWHKKFTIAIATFLLFLVGVALGAIIKKGGLGVPVLVSILVFLLYYMMSIIFEKYAKGLKMEVPTAMWFSSFVLAPIGVFLLFKTNKDSKIMDLEFYSKILKRFK